MARKRGGLRPSVYQGADHWSILFSFSQRLQSALAQDPKKYSCRWLIHLMLISKNQT
jgi:hypothetical protein